MRDFLVLLSLFLIVFLQNTCYAANISLEDLPAYKGPGLLISDGHPQPKTVLTVELPMGSKVLFLQRPGVPIPLLVQRLRQANNQVVAVSEKKDDRNLVRLAQRLKPDILLLPLGFDNPGLAPEARLAIYYSPGEPWGNTALTLSQEEIEKKAETMKRFHLSQVKRTDFTGIVHATAEEDGFREPFVLPEGVPLEFSTGDTVIVAAPHPDDAEIGAGGLIQRLQQQGIRTIVWNITTGHRSQMQKRDVIGSAHFSPRLRQEILLSRDDILQDPQLKRRIRQEESEASLHFLNAHVEVKHLALPFYDAPQYAYDVRDRRAIAQNLEKPAKESQRVILLTPWPEDEHPAHRITTDLVREQARKFPNVIVGYYKTPWTGSWNLYDYHNGKGSRLAALVGGERLMGKGEVAFKPEALGGQRADRYLVTFLMP